MLIVRLSTGLGNQMHEYMAGYALAKELQQELVLDIEECVCSAYGYLLDHFKVPVCRKIIYAKDSIGEEEHEFYDRTLKLFGDMVILVRSVEQKKPYMDNERVIVYSGWDMADDLRGYENLYMYGYFLEKNLYYEKYWSKLKSLFVLKTENEDVLNFRNLIDGKISVGIHIRRGDILLMDWFHKAEDDYYRAAIECCRELYGDCIFCVFSDDIEYAKKMLGAAASIYYIHFHGYDDASVNEFFCLSLCNHRILTAQSTFGQLADELHQGNDSHVFVNDTANATKGKALEGKSKKRTIFLNTDDVQKYAIRYQYMENEPSKKINDKDIEYQRFLKLVEENRNHEALQAAFCLYHEKKEETGFKLCLVETLVKIGAYEEAIVELVNLQQDIAEEYLNGLILDEEQKKRLLNLYSELGKLSKKRFVIVPAGKKMPAYETHGVFDLAIVLSHLGHMVTVVYDTYDTGTHYFQKSEFLYNARGVHMECSHIEKGKVLATGVCDFYNGLDEDEIIVISEDDRFFMRERCDKSLCFMIPDEKYSSESLHSQVDYIFTQDDKLAKNDRKYIYWQDRGLQEEYIFVPISWEYGYGLRLSQRMIGMAQAISRICGEEAHRTGIGLNSNQYCRPGKER